RAVGGRQAARDHHSYFGGAACAGEPQDNSNRECTMAGRCGRYHGNSSRSKCAGDPTAATIAAGDAEVKCEAASALRFNDRVGASATPASGPDSIWYGSAYLDAISSRERNADGRRRLIRTRFVPRAFQSLKGRRASSRFGTIWRQWAW